MDYNIGMSLAEKDKINVAKNLLKEASKRGTNIILPVDFTGELEIHSAQATLPMLMLKIFQKICSVRILEKNQ